MKKPQRTKKQHFVPVGYLKLFSADQRNIGVCDKKSGDIRLQNISDTGFEKNLYTSRQHADPLDRSPVPELESEVLSIIKTVESRGSVLPRGLGVLLNFIVLQYLRTPAMREKLESTHQLFWRELRSRYKSTKPEQKVFLKKAEDIAKSFITEQNIKGITPQEFLSQDFDVFYPTEDFPRSIPLHGLKIAQLLSTQKWEFLFAPNGNEFLTNDNPFSVFPKEETPYVQPTTADVTKLIPLSKKLCLAIGGKKSKIRTKEMLPWAVNVINLGLADRAKRYIYASNKALLEDVLKNLPFFQKTPQ